MKKVIFGSALMICGMIGSVGWMIVRVIARSAGYSYFITELLAIFFTVVFGIGMVIAATGLKGDK